MTEDAPVIHSDDEYPAIPVAYKPEQNIAAEIITGFGDIETGMNEADLVIDENLQHAVRLALRHGTPCGLRLF